MSQYQHYIPQFILRSFSHPYKPPKQKDTKKMSRPHAEKGKRRGEKVLNVLDLTSDEPQLLEPSVSRWFGQDDMYKDFADAIKSKKDVEQELSKLESGAAVILQKVKKAHENGESGVWLTRVERNRLRKFLFIMKYRGPGFYEKYFCEDPQTYDSEDKHLLRAYIAKKGMNSPRNVWLHNLRAILDIDMDPKGDWTAKLPELMFPEDAKMFVFHAQASYIAFCTPAKNDDEFLLTDQCYNIFEGPTSETYCAKTKEYLGNTYLSYHEFGPISPRLIIVLRSCLLPEALEDTDPKIQELRQKWQNAAAIQFPKPEEAKSILLDLPVMKAANSYTRVVNGRPELVAGESGIPRSQHKFFFRFWPIPTRHADTINSIFLDNLLICKSIVFSSKASFKRTLETYMTTSTHGFKKVGVGEHRARSSRLACLKKLSAVLKMLGSEGVPVWSEQDGAESKPFLQSFDDVWLDVVKKLLQKGDGSLLGSATAPFWQAYCALGGTRRTFLGDLDQSWRLYKLQALVDACTVNLEIGLRKKAFANAFNLLLQHHPRRVWLYVKHRRWMLSSKYAMHQETYIGSAPLFAAKTGALLKEGPEDKIVLGKPRVDDLELCVMIIAAGVSSCTV